MAGRQLVLCDLLCFTFTKFGKIGLKSLKSIISDFYTADTINEAKCQLMDDLSKLSLVYKIPHIPRRRDCDGRHIREADDIFTLMNYIDENNLFDQLPRYVTEQPDGLPAVHLCDGDLKLFVSWMEKIESKVEHFQSSLAAIATSVQSQQTTHSLPSNWPQPRSTIEVRQAQSVDSVVIPAALSQPIQPHTNTTTGLSTHTSATSTRPDVSAAGSSYSWANILSTPNRFSALSTDIVDMEDKCKKTC